MKGLVPLIAACSLLCVGCAEIEVVQELSCHDSNDGALVASPGGDINGEAIYLWNTGATTATISGLSAGTYSVTIGDTEDETFSETTSFDLMAPDPIDPNIEINSHETETIGNDGMLTATPTGGTGTYTYLWSNAATTASISGLTAGTYTLTVTDENSCTATAEIEVVHLASLYGLVWLDLDQDAVYDDYEVPIDSAYVRLFSCDGNVLVDEIALDSTDEQGQYAFENVFPGDYCIEIDPRTANNPYIASGFWITTFEGTEEQTRVASSSITLQPGENTDIYNIGVFYDVCYPNYNLEVTDCISNGATLSWQTINTDDHDQIADHCWKIVVGGAGPQHADFGEFGLFLDYLGAGIHASLIEVAICADNPDIVITDGDSPGTFKMTYALSSHLIQPGTAYWFAVAEICDGMPAGGNTALWNFQRSPDVPIIEGDTGPFYDPADSTPYAWDDYEGYFKTKDEQFTVDIETIKPICPEESEGYAADGCIKLTIADGSTCWGIYHIKINDVLLKQSDSEEGAGDETEFSQGTYTFCGYGVDVYTVSVEETGMCNPPKSALIDDAVEVPNGMDMESPKMIVTDFFAGSLIADNLDETDTDDSADLGDMIIPEGSCSMKSYFKVIGADNCDGEICDGPAVTASVLAGPANTIPGTQIKIYNQDGEAVETDGSIFQMQGCEWVIELNWGIGESTVEICMDDAEEAGLSDPACVTITANVQDNIEPTIIAQSMNLVIPACSEQVCGIFSFQIMDGCDNAINSDAIQVEFLVAENLGHELEGPVEVQNGSFEVAVCLADAQGLLEEGSEVFAGEVKISYADDLGDEFTATAGVSVNKASIETDPVIIASGNTLTALPCEDGAEVIIGVTVVDDCEDITDDLKIEGAEGLSAVSPILNGLSGYFEFVGTLTPDEYSITFSYPGAADVTVAVIVAQEDNQAPEIDMAGNTSFTIPSCLQEVKAFWSVQISDDCDEEIDLSNVNITVGENTIEVPGDHAEVLLAEDGYVLIELSADLTLDMDGDPFIVSYTDVNDEMSSAESTIAVNGTPDLIPPVIIYPTAMLSKELDPCGSSTAEIKFAVSAIDNCSAAVAVEVDATGSESITSVSDGGVDKYTLLYAASSVPYQVTLTAQDEAGNTSSQVMWVSVTQAVAPITSLACNTGLNVPVDLFCQVELSPDLILEGSFGCLTPADIEIVVAGKDRSDPSANFTEGVGTHEFDIYVQGAFYCKGNITTFDNTPPVISCPISSIDLVCADIEQVYGTLEYTGAPTIFDNCDGATYSWYEETLYGENEACDEVQIKRVFTVTDGAGKTDECEQLITIRKPTLADVSPPNEVVELSCDDEFEYDNNGQPAPMALGGYPYITTFFGKQNLAPTYCNLAATYSDSDRIEVCEGNYKFIRTWSVLDWCNPADQLSYTQLIKVGDFEAPLVSALTIDYDWDGAPDILEFSPGPFECTAAFEVPLPIVSDNCSSSLSITTEVLADGNIPILVLENEDNRYVSEIPLGCHAFRYWVSDGCGNQSDITVPFVVVDKVAPTAICDDELNITLENEGFARVYAADFDEGSWDNCTAITLQVRRALVDEDCLDAEGAFTSWGPYVDFNCCDIGRDIRVELRVWDDANFDGMPGSVRTFGTCGDDEIVVADNNNICWLDVRVEDKQAPHCSPPHAQSVSCATLPYDFDPNEIELLEDLFGQADFSDNCTGVEGIENPPIVTIDDCGAGTILRSFTATDAGGLTSGNCEQLITIEPIHNYEIGFPADSQVDCGVADPDTIITKEIGCDLLAISSEDEVFSASGDECYKLFRTYRVINWCEYDGEAAPVVVSRDEDCDGQPGDEAIWVIRRNNGGVYFDRDNNESNNNPAAGQKGTSCDGISNPSGYWIDNTIDENATRDPITGQEDNGTNNDNIRDIDSRGYWQYTQVIKVYDSVDPVIKVEAYGDFESLDGVNCDAPVTINFTIEDECTEEEGLTYVWLDAFIVDADGDGNFTQAEFVMDADMTANVFGEALDYSFQAELPTGQHALLIKGSDGCGNEAVDLIVFTVVDAKAPSPICINGLAIELMPTEPGTDADGDGDVDAAAMTIWANDFITSPVYDCHGQGPEVDDNGNKLIVDYSINLIDEEPDRHQTALILTCDSEETTIVEIHAWDEAGNHDLCQTFVLVQDLMARCDTETGAIAGVIEAAEGEEGVAAVQVQISGAMTQVAVTQDDGAFAFHNIPLASDVSILPTKDDDPLNGVTTFDLILISKHILGDVLMDSPWKLLAADANNNGSISTIDVISIRRIILGMEDHFADNSSWRFFQESQGFVDPTNPWSTDLQEITSINNVEEEMEVNFKGVKIGDVNGSARPNAFSQVDERTKGAFTLQLEDVEMELGETYEIEFKANQIDKIAGYQGTLTIGENLELVDIVYGVAKEGNFGTRYVQEGFLTTSWDGEAKADQVLFSLKLRSKNSTTLSEEIGLSSSITPTEAYGIDGETLDLAINFSTGKVQEEAFELYQNQPNPFLGETVIGYNLPAAAQVTFTVSDVAGRTLKMIRVEGGKGYNTIILNGKDLPAAAVLYYTVSTDDYTATKKMIIQ